MGGYTDVRLLGDALGALSNVNPGRADSSSLKATGTLGAATDAASMPATDWRALKTTRIQNITGFLTGFAAESRRKLSEADVEHRQYGKSETFRKALGTTLFRDW